MIPAVYHLHHFHIIIYIIRDDAIAHAKQQKTRRRHRTWIIPCVDVAFIYCGNQSKCHAATAISKCFTHPVSFSSSIPQSIERVLRAREWQALRRQQFPLCSRSWGRTAVQPYGFQPSH
jgi:hypothetical protein